MLNKQTQSILFLAETKEGSTLKNTTADESQYLSPVLIFQVAHSIFLFISQLHMFRKAQFLYTLTMFLPQSF